jgi:hypothetical protein
MNPEELKLILDTISTVSGNAGTAAIWWMALHYGSEVVKVALVAGGFIAVSRLIINAVTWTSEWARLGREVARAWGPHCSPISGLVSSTDRAAIRKAVAAAQEARK